MTKKYSLLFQHIIPLPRATNSMPEHMKAAVWEGKPFHMTVKNWPVPRIRDPSDVVVRLTTAAICGTDLHDYHGKDKIVLPICDFMLGHYLIWNRYFW